MCLDYLYVKYFLVYAEVPDNSHPIDLKESEFNILKLRDGQAWCGFVSFLFLFFKEVGCKR